MIPQLTEDLLSDVEYNLQPTYTYEMNLDKESVIGTCQGKTAMEQAVYKIVNTERYQTPIYSWNYGVELADLFGKPTSYCIPEIERRITEALMQDDRISNVYNFEFEIPRKGVIYAKFNVDTTEGVISGRKEVNY